MRLEEGDTIVVNASAFLKRGFGDFIVEKVLKERVKVAVCDKLLEEYWRNVSKVAGYSPASFALYRIRPLEEKGQLTYMPDGRLADVAPREEHDSHLVNLYFACKARLVLTANRRHAEKLGSRYGVLFVSPEQFRDP